MTLVRSQFKGIGDGAHNVPYSPTSGVPRSDVQGAVEKVAGDASGAVSDAATALAAANAAQSDIDTHAARTDNPHGVTAVQVGAQPLDDDLTAIAALSSTGFPVRTASNTWAQRSLANAAAGLTWTNPAGIAGNPTPIFANDLAALEGLGSTGFAARTATDTWAQRSIAVSGSGLSISNGNGVGGNPTISLADDVAAIEALSPSNDDIIQRKAGAWSNRTIAQLLTDLAAAGTTFQPLDSDLTAIAALSTTSFGRSVLTQADASALRTLAGLVIGTNVQAYDADLASIAALSTASYGRSLLELADAASLRTAAGLGTAALQDYEDGTFSPVPTFQTPGDISNSFNFQLGYYARIGKLVLVSILLQWTPTYTTSAGNFLITGLPFASEINAVGGTITGQLSGLTYPTSRVFVSVRFTAAGATSLAVVGFASAASASAVTTTQMPSGTQQQIITSFVYYMD
jgi:hypothetical protein